jgi:hypothetical protein
MLNAHKTAQKNKKSPKKYFKKLQNQKHVAVDVLFKAYPMIPLSG